MNKLTFAALGIGAPLCRALDEIGYETPTPIQAQAIPDLLAGEDLLGIAQTGTGKTGAFALPILDMLAADRVQARARCPAVLILAPTRELAAQICDELKSYARHTKLRCERIFGGVNINPQIKMLGRGVEVLVATPGRLLDLAGSGHVRLDEVTHVVLDEADRLLDMGFIRDVRKIIDMLPDNRQSLLFSATMPREVAELASEILYEPIRIDVSPEVVTVEKIDQRVLMVDNADKQHVLEQLLREPSVTRAIVFARTKHGANKIAKKLNQAGVSADAIHGNKSQNARLRALESFKAGEVLALVATDIAARGIDIDGISHIINFELPHEPESYVHRIGRTARAGSEGVAWSLVDGTETKRLRAIERMTKVRLAPLDLEAVAAAAAPAPPVEKDAKLESRSEQPRRRRRRRRRGGQRKAAAAG